MKLNGSSSSACKEEQYELLSKSRNDDDHRQSENEAPGPDPGETPSGASGRLRKVYSALADVDWKNAVTMLVAIADFFAVYTAISVIASFFPTEAEKRGSTATTTGIIIGCAALTLTIFSPAVGYFIPKFGVKFFMMTGLFLVGTSYFGLGAATYFPSGWVFITYCSFLRLIEGLGTAMSVTACLVLPHNLFPKLYGLCLGLIQIVGGVGYSAGPIIGGYLYEAGGYQAPFFVIGGTCFIMILPTTLTFKVSAKAKKLPQMKAVIDVLKGFVVFLLYLSTTMESISFGFKVAVLELYFTSEFSVTQGTVGLIFLAQTIPYVAGAIVAGIISDFAIHRAEVITGLLVTGIGFLLMGLTAFLPMKSIYWLEIFGLSLTALGAGVVFVPVLTDLINLKKNTDIDKEDSTFISSFTAGFLASCVSFGQFIGSIIGGAMYQYLGFEESAAIHGEVFIALTFLLLGVTIIHKSTKDF